MMMPCWKKVHELQDEADRALQTAINAFGTSYFRSSLEVYLAAMDAASLARQEARQAGAHRAKEITDRIERHNRMKVAEAND